MNKVETAPIVISDFLIFTLKPYSGLRDQHFKGRRPTQKLISIRPPDIPVHPSSTCRGSEPHHMKRRTSARRWLMLVVQEEFTGRQNVGS